MSTVEAVDVLRFADVISERIATAQAELGKKRGLEREKEWLTQAAQVLDGARAPAKGLVDKARGLAELADLREEFASVLQNAWVDSLEKLIAGITFHVSGRSPVIESLYPHQKLPVLRKAPRDVAQKFMKDFEKRAKSGYVSRMLGGEDFAFATPVLEQIRRNWAEYEACFSGEGMPEEEAAPLRRALVEAGESVEQSLRQARLLAEAALVPLEGAFDQSGIGQKLKKRPARSAAAESQPHPAADGADVGEDAVSDDAEAAEASGEVGSGAAADEAAADEAAEAGGSGAAASAAQQPAEAAADAERTEAPHQEPAASEASAAPATDTVPQPAKAPRKRKPRAASAPADAPPSAPADPSDTNP